MVSRWESQSFRLAIAFARPAHVSVTRSRVRGKTDPILNANRPEGRKEIRGFAGYCHFCGPGLLYSPAPAKNLPLLQSFSLLLSGTQGFAKPPPWAELFYRFAVSSTGSQAIIWSALRAFPMVGGTATFLPGKTDRGCVVDTGM
jgi:hypothetical protein